LNPAKAQMDQVQRFAEKLRRWEDERFYGEVTLRLKDGQIRMVEVKQTEVWDQAAGGGEDDAAGLELFRRLRILL
jgi:hypothetical protein